MKKYMIFVLFFIPISCHYNSSSEQNRKEVFNKSIINNDLYGEWSINIVNSLTCNECPNIFFGKKRRGRIIKPSNEISQFNWTIIEESMIRIQPFNDNIKYPDFFIEFGDYNLKFDKHSNYLEVTFSGITEENEYTLRKIEMVH